ncbi:hypothetical protein [Novosphingobium pentaromativorans]|uniref:Uncharacterized protein n=1 Tax=Novosphingobium pentaromativorans US6-1 TaxID=1088721 RepID=G6EAR7_9SPHN|nr:hypothetical protein [Novosphingobium pentaromativorans]AIT80588.1 hypothetical protein JI59_12825 [Novosphingobium pentaromativorans US6-1]EHJ61704.1 hypothetical protein NSU_1465 [Novosphingobium pentaromativorans US6-1]
MQKVLAAVAVAATLLAAPVADARTKLTGEEQLAKMLDGREAGKPVNCIPSYMAQDTRVIDKTAIVYRVGRTLYVNRPSNADSLDDDDILVTKLHSSQLCRLDTVQLHDRGSHFWNGFVGLQDFVPYTKIASAK